MSKSIIQDYSEQKYCFHCGRTSNLEDHHIFNGSNRKHSEKYGLKVLLCGPICHRDNKLGVHGQNTELRKKLQIIAQSKFEETHTREEFMKIIGKNYL